MLFKNLFSQGRFTILEFVQESLSPLSCLSKKVKYSSQTKSSDWVCHNQLFQRHPRLRLFEEQWGRAFHQLKPLVSYVVVSGLNRNPFVMGRILYLSLVESEGINGVEKSAFGVKIFNQIREPNLFSWNTMIRFFAGYDPLLALNYYMKMVSQEMLPDEYTFPFVLQACGTQHSMQALKQVHCHIVKRSITLNLFVRNSLLNTYMICNSASEAMSVFEEMQEKDIVSWTSLISGLVLHSNYGEGILVFKNLLSDDSQPQPNVITIISTMSACGSLGYTDLTRCFHAMLEKAGWLEQDVAVVNSLMDAYAKCGNLDYVTEVFDSIPGIKRDLYSWTAIISGFTIHGRGQDALNAFSRMEQESKLVPDGITFVAILSACAHSGLVQEGLDIFESMSAKYGIEPDVQHYGCIVDLLGRSGMLDRAYSIIENMPVEPNLPVLGSLLNGCKIHNNMVLGMEVLRKIEVMEERGGAAVIMSNMYANENEWSKVEEIRRELRGRMPVKPLGRSSIQIQYNVHEFIAGNEIDGVASCS